MSKSVAIATQWSKRRKQFQGDLPKNDQKIFPINFRILYKEMKLQLSKPKSTPFYFSLRKILFKYISCINSYEMLSILGIKAEFSIFKIDKLLLKYFVVRQHGNLSAPCHENFSRLLLVDQSSFLVLLIFKKMGQSN